MKLRTALKIYKAVGGSGEDRYSEDQKGRALKRYQRTASSKESNKFFADLMDRIGPEGRAKCIAKSMPAEALRILCEQVEGVSFA